MGLLVFPLLPGTKVPASEHGVKDATTDVEQIDRWWTDMPDAGIGLAAEAVVGGACFLEFDQKPWLPAWAKELGEEKPATRLHKSGGKGGPHYIFKHSEKSLALGNCDGSRDGHEWFSFRAGRRYIVAPPSISPDTNQPYSVESDIEPIPIPDWLVDEIAKRGVSERKASANMPEVDESFEIDDFLEWVPAKTGSEDGGWVPFLTCPVAGRRHKGQGVRGCALFYDGGRLGFRCMAAECPSNIDRKPGQSGIGFLVSFLSDQQGAYPGVIWPQQSTEELAEEFGAQEAFDDKSIEDEAPAASGFGEAAARSEARGGQTMEELFAERAEELNPAPLPIPTTVAVTPIGGTLDFPGEFAMYGKLKEIALNIQAKYPDLELGWLYPSLLGIASMLPITDLDGHVRSNLYVTNLGESRHGKSIHLDLAERAIFVPQTTKYSMVPVSDRGLANMLSEEDNSQRVGLVLDEMKMMMSKCAIDNSALAPMLCTLWNKCETGFSDKKKPVKCFGVLSCVGNLAIGDPAEFAAVFGKETTKGLAHRFIFGYSSKRVRYRPVSVKMEIFADLKPVRFPSWVWRSRDEWMGEDDALHNVSENMLRVALITAALNGDREITKEGFEAALRFAEWQARLKEVFRPGIAETKDAEAYDAIYLALWERHKRQIAEGKPPKGADEIGYSAEEQVKMLNYREVCQAKSYYRKFGRLVQSVRKDMIESGIIEEVRTVEFDQQGRDTKGKRTSFVKLKATLV